MIVTLLTALLFVIAPHAPTPTPTTAATTTPIGPCGAVEPFCF